MAKHCTLRCTKHCRDKFKEYRHKWRDLPYSRIRRPNIVQMSVLFKFIYRFNDILIKTLPGFKKKKKHWHIDSKIMWKWKHFHKVKQGQRSDTTWILYKATLIKRVWYWVRICIQVSGTGHSRNRLTHIFSIDFWQRRQRNLMEER